MRPIPLAAIGAAFLLVFTLTGVCRAQTIVAPNAFTTAEGDSQNFLPFFPGTNGNTLPVEAIGQAEIATGYTDGLRGFRVPCVLISPFAAVSAVSHLVFVQPDSPAVHTVLRRRGAAGTFPPCIQTPAGATVTNGEFSTLRQKALDAGMLIP